jgi:hypothetical protein
MDNFNSKLYLDGVLMDLDKNTRIALTDKSQPLNSFFQVGAKKSNTFSLPFTDNNDKFFEGAKSVHTNNLLKFKKYEVVYIQDDIEIISQGICRINRITNKYEIVVTTNDSDLFDVVSENPDGSQKLISDLDFSDLDFRFTPEIKMNIFKTQLEDKNTRAFFLPLIDYEKNQIAPVLQRNLNYETIQGLNSWLQTFLAYKPPVLQINYRSSTRYLFPAVKTHEIIKRIIEESGYNLVIPEGLKTEWSVIPFTNESIKLKDNFVNDRTVILRYNSDATIIHNSASTSIIGFDSITDSSNVYNNTSGYNLKELPGDVNRLCLTLQVDIEFMYYFKEQGTQPHKLKVGWRDAGNNDIDYVEEYNLENTFIVGSDDDTQTNFDYRGSPKLIKATLDLDNFEYNFKDVASLDYRLIFRVEFHGTLIIGASKTKITIKPKPETKIMRGAVWGISENLPNIKQSDFLRAFLQINGLEIKQNEETLDIEFNTIGDILTNGKENAIDMTSQLHTGKGYNLKTIGNTVPKNSVFSYKSDNTVTEPKDYTVFAGDIQTGKNSQNVFVLPFAPTDDIFPSKGQGLFDFSDAITNAYLPMCDERGFIQNKLEPRILLLNFFEGYNSPNKNDENFPDYEPPLFIEASLPQETSQEDPNLRPYGTLVDNLVTATFTNINTIKYQFSSDLIKSLKIESIVLEEYAEYTAILPETSVYEAYFIISAELYKKLDKNRVIKILKGDLEGYWYINKKENWVSDKEYTKLEIQKI